MSDLLSGTVGLTGLDRRVGPGLEVVQVGVEAVEGDQIVVGALLHDPAVIEDVNAVGVADAGQAVGDQEYGAAIGVSPDLLEQGVFGAGVEGRSRLVRRSAAGRHGRSRGPRR